MFYKVYLPLDFGKFSIVRAGGPNEAVLRAADGDTVEIGNDGRVVTMPVAEQLPEDIANSIIGAPKLPGLL